MMMRLAAALIISQMAFAITARAEIVSAYSDLNAEKDCATFAAAAFPYVRYLHAHTGRWALSAKSGTLLRMALVMQGTDPLHRARALDVMAYEQLGFDVRDVRCAPHLGFSENGEHTRAETASFGCAIQSVYYILPIKL